MSKVVITEDYLEDIADAIRAKLDVETTYTPAQMAAAIESIPTGGSATLVSKSITQNGTYDPADDNADGYSSVTVNVPASGGHNLPAEYQEVTFVENGSTSCYIDTGVVADQNTEVICTYRIWGSTTSGIVLGSRGGSTSSKRFFPVSLESGSTTERYVMGTSYPQKAWGRNNKRTVDFNDANHGVTVKDESSRQAVFTGTLPYSTYVSSNHDISLFSANDDGSTHSYGVLCEIYYVKMIDTSSDTVLAELIPCYKKSDSTIGFYDLVSESFVTGSGTFYCGEEVR